MSTSPVVTSTSTKHEWTDWVHPPSPDVKSYVASIPALIPLGEHGGRHPRHHRDLRDGDGDIRGPPHLRHTVDDLDVVGVGLEERAPRSGTPARGSRRVTPITEPLASVAARLPPVPTRENGERRGVAVDDAHRFERHAKLVRRDLAERRLVTLAVRRLAREDGQRPVGLEPQRSGALGRHAEPDRRTVVGRPGRRLDVDGDTEAEVATFGRARACSSRKAA